MSEQGDTSETSDFEHLLDLSPDHQVAKCVLEDARDRAQNFQPSKRLRLDARSTGVESTTLFKRSTERHHIEKSQHSGAPVVENAYQVAPMQSMSQNEGVADPNPCTSSSRLMGNPVANPKPHTRSATSAPSSSAPSSAPSQPSGSGSNLGQTATSSSMPPYPGLGLPTPDPTTCNAILKLLDVTEQGDSLRLKENADNGVQEAMIDVLFDAADAVEVAINTYILTELKLDGRFHPIQENELVESLLLNDNLGHAIYTLPELKPGENLKNKDSKKDSSAATLLKEHQSKEAIHMRAVAVAALNERGDTVVELPGLGEAADPEKTIRNDEEKYIEYNDTSRPRNTSFEAEYTLQQWAFHYVSKLTMLGGSAVLGILPAEITYSLEILIDDSRYTSNPAEPSKTTKKNPSKAKASAKKPQAPKLGPSFIGLIVALICVSLFKKLRGSGAQVYWCRTTPAGRAAFLRDLDLQYQWRAWIIRWLDQNTVETYSIEYFLRHLRETAVTDSGTVRGLSNLHPSSLQTFSPSYLAGILHNGTYTPKPKGRNTFKKRDVPNATENLDDQGVRFVVPPVQRQGPEIYVSRLRRNKAGQPLGSVDSSKPSTEPSKQQMATPLSNSPTSAAFTMPETAFQPHNPSSVSTSASASVSQVPQMMHGGIPSSNYTQSTVSHITPSITVSEPLAVAQPAHTLTSHPQPSNYQGTYMPDPGSSQAGYPSETMYSNRFYGPTTTSMSSSVAYISPQSPQSMQHSEPQQMAVPIMASVTEPHSGDNYGEMEVEPTPFMSQVHGSYTMQPGMVSAMQLFVPQQTDHHDARYSDHRLHQDQHQDYTHSSSYGTVLHNSTGDVTPTQGHYTSINSQVDAQSQYGGVTWDQMGANSEATGEYSNTVTMQDMRHHMP